MYEVNNSPRPLRLSPHINGAPSQQSVVIGVLQPQPILRAGLEKVLSHLLEGAEIHAWGSVAELLENSQRLHLDMVITELNLRLPECSLSCLERVRKSLPKTQILTLSPLSERQFGLAALRVGANGFLSLSTSMEEFSKAIQTVLSGAGYISNEMAAVVADEAQGRIPGLALTGCLPGSSM